mgnify:FL=1
MKCTSMNLQVYSLIRMTMADLCKTDLQKVISYLDEAAKIYDALPMQKCKCRAHMITQLTNKLKSKLNHDKK